MARPATDKKHVREQLLLTMEQMLKKHGAAKITVSEIAAVCNMSQSNAYRFFPSKKALMEAAAARWFEDIDAELKHIAHSNLLPEVRLEKFLKRRYELKWKKYRADPELFEAYLALASENMQLADIHLESIRKALRSIVDDCIATGVFPGRAGKETVELIELLSVGFSNPWLIVQRRKTTTLPRVEASIKTLITGLKERQTP